MRIYSDKDLLEIIIRTAKKLKRTPKRREVKNNSTILSRFGSWNQAIKKAGLKPNNKKSYTKKELIQIIKDYYKKNKTVPRQIDFAKNPKLPDPTTIKRKFNLSWQEILKKVNLNPRLNYLSSYNYTDEQLLQMFKKEYLRIKPRNYQELFRNRKNIPSLNYYKKRFKCNYNGLLKKCGLSINLNSKFTKEFLIQQIKKLYKQLKRTPTISDLDKLQISRKTFDKYFTSWNSALLEAGIPIIYSHTSVIHTNEELIEMYKQFSEKIGKGDQGASSLDLDNSDEIYNSNVFTIRFGSMSELKKLCGYPPGKKVKKYSKEDIEKKLLDMAKKLKRKPTNQELKNDFNLPSTSTILRYYKTTKLNDVWKEIFKKYNLTYKIF